MTILNFSVADSSDCSIATLNDINRHRLISEGKCLYIRNFVLRSNKIVLTKNSKIMTCSEVTVPFQLEELAVHLICPPSPMKKVCQIKTMPLKSVVTVTAKIVKDECVRTVKVGGQETSIHTIRIENDGAEVNLSLWRDMAHIPIGVGQYIEVTECVTGEWQGQPQLNTTRNSTLTQVDVLEEMKSGMVEGISIDSSELELAIETNNGFEDLTVKKDVLLSGLQLGAQDNESLEEVLTNMLPFKVKILSKGGNISTITKEDSTNRGN